MCKMQKEFVHETPSTSPWEAGIALWDRMVTALSGKAWAQKRVHNHWACSLSSSHRLQSRSYQGLPQTHYLQPSNPHHETLWDLSERLLVAQREQHSLGTLTDGTIGWRGQQSPPGCCVSMPRSSRQDASVCKIFLWLSYFTCRGVLSQKHSHRTTQQWAAHHPPLGRPTGGNTASRTQPQRSSAFLITAAAWSNGEREILCLWSQSTGTTDTGELGPA